jgi:hypothetical protein
MKSLWVGTVNPHQNYLKPSIEFIEDYVEKNGYKKAGLLIDYGMLQDFAAAASYLNPKEIDYIDYTNKEIPVPKWVPENYKEKFIYETKQRLSSYRQLIKQIDWPSIKGYTPLEKAVTALTLMQANNNEKLGEEGLSGKVGGRGASTAKGINMLNDSLTNVLPNNEFFNPSDSEGDGLKDIDLLKMNREDLAAIQKLSIVKQMSHLKIPTKITKRVSPKGKPEITSIKNKKHLVRKATHAERIFGQNIFNLRFVEGSLKIKTKIESEKGKQLLIALIDDSGSMSSLFKQSLVKALLYNWFDAVCSGKAELLVAMFETTVYKHTRLTSREDCDRFLKQFSSPHGGGTDVCGAIKHANQSIKELKFGDLVLSGEFSKAQTLVINDGQDVIDTSYTPEIKTHAIVIGQNNNDLKNLVERSNGTYLCFQENEF